KTEGSSASGARPHAGPRVRNIKKTSLFLGLRISLVFGVWYLVFNFMPPWLLWTILAVFSWGIWAILSKLIGDALSAAQSQALSTLGLVPVAVALGLSRRLSATGERWRGMLFAFAAGALACAGNVAYYRALQVGDKAATVVALTGLY